MAEPEKNCNALMKFQEQPIHKNKSISLHYSNILFYCWGLLFLKGGGNSSSFAEGIVLTRILLRISKYQAQHKHDLTETSQHPYEVGSIVSVLQKRS